MDEFFSFDFAFGFDVDNGVNSKTPTLMNQDNMGMASNTSNTSMDNFDFMTPSLFHDNLNMIDPELDLEAFFDSITSNYNPNPAPLPINNSEQLMSFQNMPEVQQNITELQQNNTQVQQNSTAVQQNIIGVQQNKSEVRQNITGVQQNLTEVRQNITGVQQNITEVPLQMELVPGIIGNIPTTNGTVLDLKHSVKPDAANNLYTGFIVKDDYEWKSVEPSEVNFDEFIHGLPESAKKNIDRSKGYAGYYGDNVTIEQLKVFFGDSLPYYDENGDIVVKMPKCPPLTPPKPKRKYVSKKKMQQTIPIPPKDKKQNFIVDKEQIQNSKVQASKSKSAKTVVPTIQDDEKPTCSKYLNIPTTSVNTAVFKIPKVPVKKKELGEGKKTNTNKKNSAKQKIEKNQKIEKIDNSLYADDFPTELPKPEDFKLPDFYGMPGY